MDDDPAFRVRTGNLHDYTRLGIVFDEAERFHRQALPHIFREPAERFPSQTLYDALVDSDDSAVMVAESGTELVGFAAVRTEHAPEDPMLQTRRFAMLDMLAVRSDKQRQGIGRALMEAVHRWAHERDLHNIELNVWESNQRAIHFYQALGYQTVSRRMERRGS